MPAIAFPPGRLARAALALAALAGGARAGEGTVAQGRLDLLVYFAYDEVAPAEWEPLFASYSDLLLNATEGGLQLGRVSFTTCANQKSQADVWILPDTSGARAHLNGLGVLGRHMTISQTHKSTMGQSRGQFGLVHESGHYLFGCYDEYKGFVGSAQQSDPSHYCSTGNGVVACFMDGGTTVAPNHLRTEFCTRTVSNLGATSHFRGTNNAQGQAVRTDQEVYLGRSCWEQIQLSGVGNLVHPAAPPSTMQPPGDDVLFDYGRLNGVLAMALVLDRSGSMSSENKLALAKLSAQVSVGLLRDGEFLSVVAFDDDPQVIFPASPVNDGSKALANQAIEALVPGGGTTIGSALLEASAQLATVQGCKEFIVVISDGASDPPDADAPEVIAALTAAGLDVYAVSLGSFAQDGPLAAVAAATGGEFHKATTAEELPGTFASIFARASGGTAVEEAFEVELPGGGSEERTFEVGAAARFLRASLSFPSGAAPGLELVGPLGAFYDFDGPPDGVEIFASPVQKTMRIPSPEPGIWTATIRERSGSGVPYDFFVFVESLELDVTVGAQSERVAYPEPMRIAAQVVAGVPVGGAGVSAEIGRPDGSSVEVELFDDGLAIHADEKADDGVYGALFARYAGDGAYEIDLRVENAQGHAASNQECGGFGLGEEGQSAAPVAPFVACSRATVLLEGMPVDLLPATSALGAHPGFQPPGALVLAESAPTPVAAFELQGSDDEPLLLNSIELDVDVLDGSGSVLEELALHVDLDGNGSLAAPTLPLARARRVRGGEGIAFELAGAALAFLPPGEPARFLVTAGEALVLVGSGAEGGGGEPGSALLPGTTAGSGGARPPGLSWPSLRWLLPVILGLLSLRAVLGGSRRFPRPGSRRRPATRRRPSRPTWRLGAALTLTLVLLPFLDGCRTGPGRRAGTFALTLEPSGVSLEGAVRGGAVPVGGAPLDFELELR